MVYYWILTLIKFHILEVLRGTKSLSLHFFFPSYHHLVWLALIGIIANTLFPLSLVNNTMKSKSSSSKKKGPFISYISSWNIPPQEVSWYKDISDTSNNPTASSWSIDSIAEESSMAVDSQSTTEISRTSKSVSITVNTMLFLQPSIHLAEIDVVNMTSLHSPHVQTAGNNVSAANQPAASNVSISQDNGPNSSTEPTLDASALLSNQLANSDLWDGVFAPTSLLGVNKFQSYDAQNITCLLMHIGTFIKWCPLGNKPIKDFSDLAKVSFATWHLINAIYESGWNRLSTDNNEKLIWHCISECFAKTPKAMPKPNMSLPQNLLKLKENNLTTTTIRKLYA